MPTSPAKPKKRYDVKLTIKQRRYIKGLQKGLTKRAAALQAGYSFTQASNRSKRSKPALRCVSCSSDGNSVVNPCHT
jgi:hypothetical protein